MNRNEKIAVAIAAVLGVGAAGNALAVPSQSQAAATTNVLYVSGSSAAKNALLGAIENDMCGGAANALIASSTGNTNFFAVSCTPAASTGITGANGTAVFTVYYRAEGGSVVGALPLVSGSSIAQLNLNSAGTLTGNALAIPVTGSSASNGTTDTFTSLINGVATQLPRQKSGLGVTDVEPAAFVGDNYPSAYSTSVYGTASASQLANLTSASVFQQVFGIFVNKTGLNTPICLSSWAVASLLDSEITDWSKVEDCATHTAVASGSVPVTIVNREAGSGSRAATSIFWLNDLCDPNAVGVEEDQVTDYFSTGNVLAAAATTNGAVTYASIDNDGAQANLVLASIDGVAPTNLAAAQGQYKWWVESSLVTPTYSIPAVATSIANFLVTDLQNGNTAPHSSQINLIPGSGSNTTAAIPASTTANTCSNATCSVKTATAIYVNPFTKLGHSCQIPTSAL
jgi:hypothetical protein